MAELDRLKKIERLREIRALRGGAGGQGAGATGLADHAAKVAAEDKGAEPVLTLDNLLRALDYGSGVVRSAALGVPTSAIDAVAGTELAPPNLLSRTLRGEAPQTAEYLDRAGVPAGIPRSVAGFAGDVVLSPGGIRAVTGAAAPAGRAARALYTAADPLDSLAALLGKKAYKSAFKDLDAAVGPGVKAPSDVALERGVKALSKTGRDAKLQATLDALRTGREETIRPFLDEIVPRATIETPTTQAADKVIATYGMRAPGEQAKAEILGKLQELGGDVAPIRKVEEVRKFAGEAAQAAGKAANSPLSSEEVRQLSKARQVIYGAQEKAARDAAEGAIEFGLDGAARKEYARAGKDMQSLLTALPESTAGKEAPWRKLLGPAAGAAGAYGASRIEDNPELAALSLLLGLGSTTGGRTYGGALLNRGAGPVVREVITPSSWEKVSEEKRK